MFAEYADSALTFTKDNEIQLPTYFTFIITEVEALFPPINLHVHIYMKSIAKKYKIQM